MYTHISYQHVLPLPPVPPPNHTHPSYSCSKLEAPSLPVSYLCSRHFENLPVGNADTSFGHFEASLLTISSDKSRNSVVHSTLSASLFSVPCYKWYRYTWKVLQQQSHSHSHQLLSCCERKYSCYWPLRVTKAGFRYALQAAHAHRRHSRARLVSKKSSTMVSLHVQSQQLRRDQGPIMDALPCLPDLSRASKRLIIF